MCEPGPAFSVADVHRGWRRAFLELGCQVVNFNFADRLSFYGGAHLKHPESGEWVKAFSDEAACQVAAKGLESAVLEVWPDLVFVTSGFFLPPAFYELLTHRRIPSLLFHTESPYEDNRQMRRAAVTTYNVINDPTNLEAFRAVNPNTWYLPHSYDPAVHHPGPPVDKLRSDFAFVGTGYPSRVDLLERADWTGLDVLLAGNWQELDVGSPLRKFVAHDIAACVSNDEAADIYRSTLVSANLYRQEAEAPGLEAGWAVGPREIELAACGTFFLRQARGESDLLFPTHPTFTGPEDLVEQARWWRARPTERQEAAAAARAAVADHSFVNHARQLLTLIGEL